MIPIYYSAVALELPGGLVLKRCKPGDPPPRNGDWLAWGTTDKPTPNRFLVSDTGKVFYRSGWDELLRGYSIWVARRHGCWKRRHDT